MEKIKPQSFESHARLIPLFHFFVLPVLLVNAIWRMVQLKDGISFGSIMTAIVAIALLMLALAARVFAVSVQDRVIRLEMQLRLEKLLPPELLPRVGDYTAEQLIALRFAGDDELAILAQQVLDEKLADRKSIKRRIKNWRPDYMRA